MLNIDGKLLEILDESELYLFSILLNYGVKSCPSNEVLMSRTKWSMAKLQKYKSQLIKKGVISISDRYKSDTDGKGRKSNEYVITTDLASNYKGDKLPKNKVDNNKVVYFNVANNKVSNNNLANFQGDINILKSISIEINKVLKLESIETTLTQKDFEIESLKAKIAELEKPFIPPHANDIKQAAWKSQLEESWKVELKSLPVFQELSIENQESILEFCTYKQECLNSEEGQKDKKKQIASSTAKQILKTFTNFLKDYKDELVRESICYAIQSSHSNFNPIWLLNSKNDKQSQKTENKEPEPEQLETYLLKHHQQKEVEYFKKEGKFEKWEKELEENRQRLIDMAKGYKNENITPLLLFEMFYLPLSYALNGSSPTRKQEAFERLFAKQSQYNQDKGDFRQIIKQEYEKQKA